MAAIVTSDQGHGIDRMPEFSARMQWVPGTEGTKDVALVELSGSLSTDTSAQLRESLRPAAQWRFVILEVAGVAFLDSVGVGVLVGVARSAQAAGGGLRLACAGEPVFRVLNSTGLHRIIPTHPTVLDAVNSFTKSG